MAKVGLRQAFELETRNKYTKVNCEVTFSVDGRELPSMAVLGAALEEATQLIQDRVTESYKEVPARVEAPATPENVTPMRSDPTEAVKATVAHVNRQATQSQPDPEPAIPFGSNKPWDLK